MPVKKLNKLKEQIDTLLTSEEWLEEEIAKLGILILLENDDERLKILLKQLDNLAGKLNSELVTFNKLKQQHERLNQTK